MTLQLPDFFSVRAQVASKLVALVKKVYFSYYDFSKRCFESLFSGHLKMSSQPSSRPTPQLVTTKLQSRTKHLAHYPSVPNHFALHMDAKPLQTS